MKKEQIEILNEMISDLNTTSVEEYKPSSVIWNTISNRFQKSFMEEGINNVQNQNAYNGVFSFIHNIHTLSFESALWSFYNYLKTKDTYKLLEKTVALPAGNSDYDYNPYEKILGRPDDRENKLINWDYLITLDTIITIAECNPEFLTKPITVCELGAGWGRIGYYLTQINNQISYNIFDIPHTLLISYDYLFNSVKHTKVFEYMETKNNNFINKELLLKNPGINFYTSNKLENFEPKSFDLFINVDSFQEMNMSQILVYFEKINYLSDYFYSQQRYMDLEMDYTKYPIYDNWNKIIDKDINFHPLWFEQYFKIN
jgi:putative sugar O-methyltransferase